jgi:hypothetical protein
MASAYRSTKHAIVSVNRLKQLPTLLIITSEFRIELANDQFDGGKSHATKTIYTDFLTMGEARMGESEHR